MELIEDTAFGRRLLAGVIERKVGGRRSNTEEPHLSDLIYCLTRSYWSRRDTEAGTIESMQHTPKTLLMFAIGIGLEQVLLRPQSEPRRGVFDGVQYEMDAFTEDGWLVEYKSTRMGIKKFIEEMPEGWYRQLLGYMKIAGVAKAKLAVMFIIPAELVVWEVRAEQEEVDANWKWIVERRNVFNEFRVRGKPPTAFKYNEKWECKDCSFKVLCDIEEAKSARG